MKRIGLLVLLAVVSMGQMCTGPATEPQCMTIDEVVGIPAGTANGTAFSGTYRAVSAVVENCTPCSQNTAPDPYCTAPDITKMNLSVTQQNGALRIDHPDIRMTGRIDADGSFKVGGVGTPTRNDGMKTGQALMLIQGQFVGDMIIADMQIRITMQDSSGSTLDLEQTVAVTAQRDPPAETPDLRLQSNLILRNACGAVGFPPDLGMTDQEIETFLLGFEADRLNGVTMNAELASALPVCNGYPTETQFACDTCYTEMISQVYGD